MKIFFASKESGAGDLALRLEMEGHKVKYHVTEKDEASNLEGLIEKEKNWRSGVGWCDYAVLDDTGMDEIGQFILKANKPSFGLARKDSSYAGKKISAASFATVLEKDRSFAHEIMEKLEIGERIESEQFSDIPSAIEHLKAHQVPHVIKPEVQGSGSEKTYVGHFDDNSDAIGWLETLPERPNAGKIKKIELEERIKGVEVAASAWFNGKDWIGPPNVNFEHKRIATGELGFNTGEMGTAMFYTEKPCRLAEETVYRMASFLRDFDYRGQIDVNCVVNEEGVFPLEFTPRLGYPSSYIEQEIHETPWGEFLESLAKGESSDPKFSTDWAVGVLLVGEGYPFWDEGCERSGGLLVQGLTPENIDNLHLYHVKHKEGMFITSGCLPLVATSRGKTISEAQQKVYKEVIPKVFFPGMYYRIDVGDRCLKDLKQLKSWGYDFGRID